MRETFQHSLSAAAIPRLPQGVSHGSGLWSRPAPEHGLTNWTRTFEYLAHVPASSDRMPLRLPRSRAAGRIRVEIANLGRIVPDLGADLLLAPSQLPLLSSTTSSGSASQVRGPKVEDWSNTRVVPADRRLRTLVSVLLP